MNQATANNNQTGERPNQMNDAELPTELQAGISSLRFALEFF
jgi:hypothetical protein